MELLHEVLPKVVASMEGADHYGPGLIQLSLTNLHTMEKTVEHVDDLMVGVGGVYTEVLCRCGC